MASINQITVNGTTYDIEDSSAMSLVSSPTADDILTVDSSGQATDSGTKISDLKQMYFDENGAYSNTAKKGIICTDSLLTDKIYPYTQTDCVFDESGNPLSNVFQQLANVSLDTVTYNYHGYAADSCTNKPTTYGGLLISTTRGAGQYGSQLFCTYAQTGQGVYYRRFSGGAWLDWRKLSDTYKSGDTLTLGGTHCAGTLTGTRNLVRFFIPLSKPVTATTVSVSKLRMTARGVSGTIINNVDVASATGYSITAKTIFVNGLYIQVTLSTASTFTNDTVLEAQIDDGVFTFS